MKDSAEHHKKLPVTEALLWACVLEASAAKLGNVHPRASFSDLTYSDFVRSAAAVAPVLAVVGQVGVGRAVFESIRATREVVTTNTNLGIVLLLAPLAAVPAQCRLIDGIGDVLQRLAHDDAIWVYRAIRLAQPGGLGMVANNDVVEEPSGTLLDVMRLAADRDGIAAQYDNDFSWVLRDGVLFLSQVSDFTIDWEDAIIALQLRLLADHPDTLIARKCGRDVAFEASRRAKQILQESNTDRLTERESARDFDRWLRADGNRRNPGTTADLVTACLFAALRDEVISQPTLDLSATEFASGRILLHSKRIGSA